MKAQCAGRSSLGDLIHPIPLASQVLAIFTTTGWLSFLSKTSLLAMASFICLNLVYFKQVEVVGAPTGPFRGQQVITVTGSSFIRYSKAF